MKSLKPSIPTEEILRVRSLKKYLKSKLILNNVNFVLEPGENLLIKGESGCGKTTLLRCLALLDEIDDGQIFFKGKLVSRPGSLQKVGGLIRPAIGMVFQHLYLWPHMTILQNVALPLRLRNGGDARAADEIAKQCLSSLGIGNKAHDLPSQLSGGQLQRAALARALVHSPRLLLLDEITANLDQNTAHRVIEVVEEIATSKTSVIMVTHADIGSRKCWPSVLRFSKGVWLQERLYH